MCQNKGQLIGQGYTAEVYEWGEDKILKLYRKGLPEFICKSEYTITRNIYNQLKICPMVHEIVNIENRIGIVFEKITGKTMLEEMFQNILTLKTQSRMLAHYHLSIQKEVQFELPTVKEKLKKDIQRVQELSTEEKTALYKHINELPDGQTLCHFDFHPGNIIMKNHEPIIIDWMTACKGNPLSDFTRTLILLKYSEIPSKSKILKNLIGWLKRGIYQEYKKEYIKLTKASQQEIDRWELPIMAARLSEWIPEDEKKRLIDRIHSAPMFKISQIN